MTLNLKEPLEYYDLETGETAPKVAEEYRRELDNREQKS